MNSRIPNEADWSTEKKVWDYFYAREHLFGKTLEAVIPFFESLPLSAYECLLYSPATPFQYYVMAFVALLTKTELTYEYADLEEIASCFLGILEFKLKNDVDAIAPVAEALIAVAENIVEDPGKFGVGYGDTLFKEQFAKIVLLSKKNLS